MKYVVPFLLFMILIVSTNTAFAARFGAYLDFSAGSGEAEWDSDSDSFDLDTSAFSGGFIFDTNPLGEKVFSYRMNLGLSRSILEDENNVDAELVGLYLENIFAFGLVRSDTFRWWLGPLLRIGFHSGETDTVYTGNDSYEIEYNLVEFGVGVATGLNIKSGAVILSPSLGIRFKGTAGEGKYKSNGYTEKEDVEGSATEVFLNFAVLF